MSNKFGIYIHIPFCKTICPFCNFNVYSTSLADYDGLVSFLLDEYNRMKTFADFEKYHGRFVVCDFVCPTKATRENFDADIVVWMDTIKEGRYEDTNKLFQDPERVDFHITEWNEHNHEDVAREILKNV